MKFNTAVKLMLAALLWCASQAGMAGTLSGSRHDFSSKNWGSTTDSAKNSNGKICVVCHTPHNSDISAGAYAPLWNHAASTTTTYTSLYASATMKATVGQPGPTSKLCLSCHDGTVALDSFAGNTGSTLISASGFKAGSNLGTALNNDHPIGIVYDASVATVGGPNYNVTLANPDAVSVTIGSGSTVKTGLISATMLYPPSANAPKQVECSSCHDVHNTFVADATPGTGMVKMAGSGTNALCTSCHLK